MKIDHKENTKNRKQKRKLIPKNEGISDWKAVTNTQKLNWNILANTDVFLDQMRVNVCGLYMRVLDKCHQGGFDHMGVSITYPDQSEKLDFKVSVCYDALWQKYIIWHFVNQCICIHYPYLIIAADLMSLLVLI